tara:strand:+ start:453 stop:848 length:396 start_codon:yes stop_codon:yes gene_type:complete
MPKTRAQQAAIAIAMKKAGKKPKTARIGMKVDPAEVARTMLVKKADPASFKKKLPDQSKAEGATPQAKKGMKFNPKYTRGSSDVAKRKKLMQQISNIYKKYRGTKTKRKKKGFPPAVEARLKRLMKQRDKI